MQLLHPYQMYPRCKFGDRRSVACRYNTHIRIFYDVLKVGQGDLVFGVRGLFTGMSMCTRFQMSVSSGYDFCQDLMSQTDRQTDGFCTEYMKNCIR